MPVSCLPQTWNVPKGHCRGGLACVPRIGNNCWLITWTRGEEHSCLWSNSQGVSTSAISSRPHVGSRHFKSQENGSTGLVHPTLCPKSLLSAGRVELAPFFGSIAQGRTWQTVWVPALCSDHTLLSPLQVFTSKKVPGPQHECVLKRQWTAEESFPSVDLNAAMEHSRWKSQDAKPVSFPPRSQSTLSQSTGLRIYLNMWPQSTQWLHSMNLWPSLVDS